MDRLPDLLRDIRKQLNEAVDATRAEAEDAGTDDSPYWTISYDLQDACEFVEEACKLLPEED